jgi:hypothetical protein
MTTLIELFRRLTARRSVMGDNSTIQIFISYAHEDEQAVAGLVADLKQEGVDVWFAPRKLQPGDHISREVKASIEKAKFFLVALTQHSRNSVWVAKETEYALDLEKKSKHIRVLPLYVTTRDAPEVLKDHLAIDIRPYIYRAGIRELTDTIRGNLAPGRTPLERFDRFVSSLPIVDEEVEQAFLLARVAWRTGEGQMEGDWTRRCEETKGLLKRKEFSERDCDRILGELGRVLPALTASEVKDARAWLRVGQPATLAIASQLYENRFVSFPSKRRILKSDIVHQIQAWVHRARRMGSGLVSCYAAPLCGKSVGHGSSSQSAI